MAFHDAVFPVTLEKESASPWWENTIITMGNGHESRNIPWQDALWVVNAVTPTLTLAQYRQIYRHFNGRRATGFSFPLLMRTSFSATAETFGTGDGLDTTFQLLINEGDATNAYNREVYKPKSGTISIYKNAVLQTATTHYSIDYSTGVVTFVTPPPSTHILTWTGEFYIPVRYMENRLPAQHELFMWVDGGRQLVGGGQILLQETRDYS